MSEEQEDYEPGEQKWIAGNHAAWMRILGLCLAELNGTQYHKDAAVALGRAVDELGAIRVALRELSEELGCNDWPDDLHLADVVEKYIGRAIEGRR